MNSQTLDSPHISAPQAAPADAATAPARPTSTWRVCRALLVAGLLETIRRRDVYVVLVLTALMVIGAYSFTFFGVSGLEIFVKDMAFTAVGLFSTILAVTIAARQVPEELQRRTIYPLLARPVTRWQLLLGKWLGAWATSSLCFLLLCATALALLLVLKLPVGAIFWQYVLLKIVSLAWLTGFTIFLSLYLSPGAAVTLGLLLSLGSGALTRGFLMAYTGSSLDIIANVFYGLMPQYTLFDLTSKVVYGWKPISLAVIGALIVYGLVMGAFWLGVGWLRFRKQTL